MIGFGVSWKWALWELVKLSWVWIFGTIAAICGLVWLLL